MRKREVFATPKKYWKWALIVLMVGYVCFLLMAAPPSTEKYHKARESRMGMLEKVRRGKKGSEKGVEIVQNRVDVDRTMVKITPEEERYTSSVIAKDARLTLKVKKGGHRLQEEFYNSKCTFQEDLYYLQPSTATRIHRKKSGFFQGSSQLFNLDHKMLQPHQILQPYQTVRLFLSKRLIWDMQDDQITAFQVDFYDYQLPGHLFPSNDVMVEPEVVGYADSVKIYLDDVNGQRMDFEGVHLQKRKSI